jgi:hypothetical protein
MEKSETTNKRKIWTTMPEREGGVRERMIAWSGLDLAEMRLTMVQTSMV